MGINRIVVKGLQFEDLVAILTTNGYDVVVFADATQNATQNTYTIEYKPHDYTKEFMEAL